MPFWPGVDVRAARRSGARSCAVSVGGCGHQRREPSTDGIRFRGSWFAATLQLTLAHISGVNRGSRLR
jgi:hypothetical protein